MNLKGNKVLASSAVGRGLYIDVNGQEEKVKENMQNKMEEISTKRHDLEEIKYRAAKKDSTTEKL